MIVVDLNNHGHAWEKQNLITITTNKRSYDIMKQIALKETYSSATIFNCTGLDKLPERIKITFCTAQGHKFSNLKPDSEHDVVTPPDGYKNDINGLWVMGVGEPVKVLRSEYQIIT